MKGHCPKGLVRGMTPLSGCSVRSLRWKICEGFSGMCMDTRPVSSQGRVSVRPGPPLTTETASVSRVMRQHSHPQTDCRVSEVGSMINKQSWWLSLSLCFIDCQVNGNLTWAGKINWLGLGHSESHANNCGFVLFCFVLDYQIKAYAILDIFVFIRLCILAHRLSRVSCNPALSQLANWTFLVRIFEDGESWPQRYIPASAGLPRKQTSIFGRGSGTTESSRIHK